MANTIEFSLCAEDRRRLDAIISLLGAVGTPFPAVTPAQPTQTKEEPKAETPKAEMTKPEEAPKPSIDLAQIQQKVVQLCTRGADTKAAVRGVINEYGTKVSDLKDKPDAWAEVWQRLSALEG